MRENAPINLKKKNELVGQRKKGHSFERSAEEAENVRNILVVIKF